ncbi:MAG: hypothetical protein ACD_35C00311G0007 [uncultured bacterium]|nr:MAG: hypothetical protein ACD_35C00311G0007 [uncultured bacterium]
MKPLFEHFNLLAPIYEYFIHPNDPIKLQSLIPDNHQGILLDAGGGTGRVSQYLHRKAEHIIVADVSFEMLQEAQRKAGIQTVRGQTESLPFQNNTFDCIIMVDAFHHVENQFRTASELRRVLKPGGWLIIEEPNIRFLGVKLIAIAEKMALMQSHFLAPEHIVQYFDHKNFNVKVEYEDKLAWICVEKLRLNWN